MQAMIGPLTEMVQLMFSMSQGSTRERVSGESVSQERVRVNERVRMRERESEGGKQIEYVINVL